MRAGVVAVVVLAWSPNVVDWSATLQGGTMQDLAPGECAPSSERRSFGGAGGGIEALLDTQFPTLEVAASADVRRAYSDDGAAETLWRAVGAVGLAGETWGLRVGPYFGNAFEEDGVHAGPSLSLRLGRRDHLSMRLGLFDQPLCFPADCVLGLELGTPAFVAGGSFGPTAGRIHARGAVSFGDVSLRLGLFVGLADADRIDLLDDLGVMIGVGQAIP